MSAGVRSAQMGFGEQEEVQLGCFYYQRKRYRVRLVLEGEDNPPGA